MAKLDIIIAPDPRLKLKCKPVAKVDAKVARLMDDMLGTMYAAPGIGLAAPQVGVTQRIIVLDVAREDEKPAPLKMANPELVWVSDEDVIYNEGCLSLPEHYADVARPKAIRVRYLDHQNDRKGFLEAWFDRLPHWDFARYQLKAAKGDGEPWRHPAPEKTGEQKRAATR